MLDYISHPGYHVLFFAMLHSPVSVLRTVYPEFNWGAWKFSVAPQSFWVNMTENELTQFFLWMEEKLAITSPQDWYRIGTRQIDEIGCVKPIQQLGGLFHLLCKFYPEIIWSRESLTDTGKKSGNS